MLFLSFEPAPTLLDKNHNLPPWDAGAKAAAADKRDAKMAAFMVYREYRILLERRRERGSRKVSIATTTSTKRLLSRQKALVERKDRGRLLPV